jgi:hypothetical protein
VAIWLERFLYGELVLAFVLAVVAREATNLDSVRCAPQHGGSALEDNLTTASILLAVIGVVTYLARLIFPNRRRWFHLAFALLLATVAYTVVFTILWAIGVGDSDTPCS